MQDDAQTIVISRTLQLGDRGADASGVLILKTLDQSDVFDSLHEVRSLLRDRDTRPVKPAVSHRLDLNRGLLKEAHPRNRRVEDE